MVILASSCAPKYGAHFAPSSPESASYEHPELASEAQISEPSNLVSTRATAAGAEQTFTDAVAPATANEAVLFNSAVKDNRYPKELSRREQKQIIKELRAKLKNMDSQEKAALKQQMADKLQAYKASPPPPGSGASNVDPVLLVIVTILLPPLGVYLYEGEINNRFWISLLLTLLFYLPGLIYSLLVIFGEI